MGAVIDFVRGQDPTENVNIMAANVSCHVPSRKFIVLAFLSVGVTSADNCAGHGESLRRDVVLAYSYYRRMKQPL